ncbi:MAG: sugar ABC transporter ATP-binding protein [Prevotella sp.]|jgi:ABC-type sugar transport system ATPase subunit|nr:sugar ABC transporter ATP-binding protein [Prevotella sp.]
MEQGAFVRLKNINKTFYGVKVLDNINFDVREGEVHALVGENGAGKSTLIKILSGVYEPDAGSAIEIGGEEFATLTPITALHKGIIVIYQDFSLFPNLSVAENIAISQHIEMNDRLLNWKKMRKAAGNAIGQLGIDIDIDARLDTLSIAKQQLVAIARALVYNIKMIVMDEPTSSLSKNEVEQLLTIVKNLKQKSISILFISHKLEELFEVSDRFTILRDGQSMGTYNSNEIDNDILISIMVGRKLGFEKFKANEVSEPIIEVKGLCKKGNFKDISFKLHKGEILTITGLVGAGRTEVLQALYGISIPDEGEIFMNGEKMQIRSTETASELGIAYVPESRQTEGLILRQSVEDNVALPNIKRLVGFLSLIQTQKKKKIAEKWIKVLNIKPPDAEMSVQQLSGGNQQRVIIAKWLETEPKVLMVDEPTNGIDVGAKEEIHKLLRDLASRGIAILMVSSELPEVLAISDNIMVMRRGRIAGVFKGNDISQEEIMNKAIINN